MEQLIKEKRNKGYKITESDFNDWDGGEIHYRDIEFEKQSYNLNDNEF